MSKLVQTESALLCCFLVLVLVWAHGQFSSVLLISFRKYTVWDKNCKVVFGEKTEFMLGLYRNIPQPIQAMGKKHINPY